MSLESTTTLFHKSKDGAHQTRPEAVPDSAQLQKRPDPCTRNPKRSEMVSQTGFTCGDGTARVAYTWHLDPNERESTPGAADATTEFSAQGFLAPSLLGDEDPSAEKCGHDRGATLHCHTRRTLRRRRSEALAFNTAGHRGAYHHKP